MKTAVKEVYAAMEEQSIDKAQETLKSAIKIIDRTAVKGALHKKNASRKVARLTRRVNAFILQSQAEA